MYSYSYDATTGGIILNSSPTVFSKEPRPVWAAEMNLLGFHLSFFSFLSLLKYEVSSCFDLFVLLMV